MLTANRIFAIAFIVIGILILIQMAIHGTGQVGFLAAAVFIALGVLRWRAAR